MRVPILLLSSFSSLITFARTGALFKRVSPIATPSSGKKKMPGAGNQDIKLEATTKNRHIRSSERRRTARVALCVPLVVEGETEANEKFSVKARTQNVSGQGGMIELDIPVVAGQTLSLINESTGQSAKCKIVAIRRGRDGKSYAGFQFVAPQCDFWHMNFTAPGAKPLRRASSLKISA